MLIGRVVGNLIATRKHDKLEGAKLMLVQPLDLDGKARGEPVLAIDSVDAGVGDRVLLVQEGKSAMQVLGRGLSAVDAAIVGVVDEVFEGVEHRLQMPPRQFVIESLRKGLEVDIGRIHVGEKILTGAR